MYCFPKQCQLLIWKWFSLCPHHLLPNICFITEKKMRKCWLRKVRGKDSHVEPNLLLFHPIRGPWMRIISRSDSLFFLFFFMQPGRGLAAVSTLHTNSIFTINNLLSFPKIFQGNTNPTDVAKTMLPKPTLTRFVRIRPVTWETGIALRFEVYGCKISGG